MRSARVLVLADDVSLGLNLQKVICLCCGVLLSFKGATLLCESQKTQMQLKKKHICTHSHKLMCILWRTNPCTHVHIY